MNESSPAFKSIVQWELCPPSNHKAYRSHGVNVALVTFQFSKLDKTTSTSVVKNIVSIGNKA